jgi:hypothetical protein
LRSFERIPWPGDGERQAAYPVTPVTRELFLVAAGALAGLVGTAGGITSLVSYPALLLAGVAPLQANVTNLVSVVACWPGSAIASRPELAGQGASLRRWGIIAALGGTSGSVLLLVTPAGVFGRVVPFLVIIGALALLLQPRIAAWRGRREAPGRGSALLLPVGLFTLSVYNGYFGAGSGVLLLALLLLTAEPDLAIANALKNMLLGAAVITSAVLFVVFAPVDWAAVAPLAAGMFVGALLGPRVTRRLPAGLLRWLVALTGLALAAWLWIDPKR